jgi:drug/metabolite transporter (DMT)-like permease
VLATGALVVLGGVLSVVTAGSTSDYVWAVIMLLAGGALVALGSSGLRRRP